VTAGASSTAYSMDRQENCCLSQTSPFTSLASVTIPVLSVLPIGTLTLHPFSGKSFPFPLYVRGCHQGPGSRTSYNTCIRGAGHDAQEPNPREVRQLPPWNPKSLRGYLSHPERLLRSCPSQIHNLEHLRHSPR